MIDPNQKSELAESRFLGLILWLDCSPAAPSLPPFVFSVPPRVPGTDFARFRFEHFARSLPNLFSHSATFSLRGDQILAGRATSKFHRRHCALASRPRTLVIFAVRRQGGHAEGRGHFNLISPRLARRYREFSFARGRCAGTTAGHTTANSLRSRNLPPFPYVLFLRVYKSRCPRATSAGSRLPSVYSRLLSAGQMPIRSFLFPL